MGRICATRFPDTSLPDVKTYSMWVFNLIFPHTLLYRDVLAGFPCALRFKHSELGMQHNLNIALCGLAWWCGGSLVHFPQLH